MTPETLRSVALFGLLSVGIHIGAWLQFGAGAPAGSGTGGDAPLTLSAADAGLAAMVDVWETPPSPATEAPRPPQVTQAAESPAVVEPRPDQSPRAQTAPALASVARPDTAPSARTEASALSAPPPPSAPGAMPPVAMQAVERNPTGPALPAPAPDPSPRIMAESVVPQAPVPSVRPRPRPASEPVVATRAAGSGGGAAAGVAGQRAAGTATGAQRAALQAQWSASIQSRIARHQRYPSGNHGDGRVKVTMVILKNGQLSQLSLAASSGRAAIDEAALQAVQRAAPFPPAPDGLEDDWYRVAQWMSFRR